jgi:tetratricopeptide (TPR) repeat protein
MNPNPKSPERRPWLPKDQQRFALWLTGAVIVAAFVVLNQRSKSVEPSTSVGPIEKRLSARHRGRALRAVRAACKRTDCACVAKAVVAGLDADAGKASLELLERAKTCQAALPGPHAEALVRAGREGEGIALAQQILARNAEEPHALTAFTLALARRGAHAEAAVAARRAIAAGRGDGGHFLLGLESLELNDLEAARKAFGEVVESEPEDVDALYNLGLTAQRQNRYGESRRQYLRVLKLKPKYGAARFNLGILAHSVGATAEAQHHLEKLRQSAPSDPMVKDLERALAAPPANPPAQALQLGAPPPAKP